MFRARAIVKIKIKKKKFGCGLDEKMHND